VFSRQRVGWYILAEPALSLRQNEPSDANELMKDAASPDEHLVLHLDVTAKQGIISDDNAVAELSVMRQVRSGHEKIVVANSRRAPLRSAAMDRGKLANDVVITNPDLALHFTSEGKVLGFRTNDCVIADQVVATKPHGAREHRIGLNNAASANSPTALDAGMWPDFHIVGQLHLVADDCCRMNFHRTPASLKLKYGGPFSRGDPMMM
jgi:hypothetical protein